MIGETENKIKDLTQEIGYDYLTLTRRGVEKDVRTLLELVKMAAEKEANITYERHSKKWCDLSETPYSSVCSAYVSYKLCFHFDLVDDFWFKKEERLANHNLQNFETSENQFTNESDVRLPHFFENILGKGPKFRAPHVLNGRFDDEIKMQLEKFTYKLRWNHKMKNEPVSDSRKIPFTRNTVTLPPPMSDDLEQQLTAMKREILKTTESERRKTKKDQKYRQFNDNLRKSKAFIKENNLTVIPSDKTNRLVVTNKNLFEERLANILEDESTYKRVVSKQTKIENQANKIIKSVCKVLPKPQLHRLLSAGSKPANFQAFIKDHKEKNENYFPLRPIASVKNTPIEKVDWLTSEILGQLVQFVPANVRNSKEVTNLLESIDRSILTPKKSFFSLDVVSLYPSIQIAFGIESVLEIAEENWDKINNWSLTIEDFKKCLTFICYNYEIECSGQTYLQIKGCPMGAHFAPPFAIITMHKIETIALQTLATKHNFSPSIYVRYIDDILIGPIDRHSNFCNIILEVFNSVNGSISFTLEAPNQNNVINFLDLSIQIGHNKIEYSWFTKTCHSEISLRKDSYSLTMLRIISLGITSMKSTTNVRIGN